ncbi:MAG: CHAD domain-containing protein [Verrucomicrobia bacterium]|nr:CHAD domain-containing protein [Verrucomicrobiota bacterium]
MNLRLKRSENLRQGLRRIAEERLREVSQLVGKDGLTAEPVHTARKTIKHLRATLRLTRGALPAEARKERNQVLRDFAGRLSGPRDAAVTLAAFEKAYRESLDAGRRPRVRLRWVAQVRQALRGQAHAPVKAETYRDAAEGVQRLAGNVLPFEDDTRKDDWTDTVETGLRKTYRQGRQLLADIQNTPDAPDAQWHELRKRVKDLGYELALIRKVKGVKPLLAKLDEVGEALGDARDLTLLRDYLNKVPDKRELTSEEQQSFRRLLAHIDLERGQLHQRALKIAQGVYRRGGKKFTTRLTKRWRSWYTG